MHGENNTQTDCVLLSDDVTIMTSSSREVVCMFRIKFPTKHIFRIFPVLRTHGMAPFCNLFMERPSYLYRQICCQRIAWHFVRIPDCRNERSLQRTCLVEVDVRRSAINSAVCCPVQQRGLADRLCSAAVPCRQTQIDRLTAQNCRQVHC